MVMAGFAGTSASDIVLYPAGSTFFAGNRSTFVNGVTLRDDGGGAGAGLFPSGSGTAALKALEFRLDAVYDDITGEDGWHRVARQAIHAISIAGCSMEGSRNAAQPLV